MPSLWVPSQISARTVSDCTVRLRAARFLRATTLSMPLRRPRASSEPPAPPDGVNAADFPLAPPIEPMLAKLVDQLPQGDGFSFEPKWDGFRAIVFRSQSGIYIQSRDLRPLD